MPEGSEFNARLDADRKSPEDMLPEYESESFLAWQLAGGDPVKYDYLMEKKYSELKRLYGYFRTTVYLSIKREDDDEEPQY